MMYPTLEDELDEALAEQEQLRVVTPVSEEAAERSREMLARNQLQIDRLKQMIAQQQDG